MRLEETRGMKERDPFNWKNHLSAGERAGSVQIGTLGL